MNQGGLPTEWTNIFNEDTIYYFDTNAFEIGSKISKGNMKDGATIASNIDNEKINVRVKFSEFPGFDGKQDSWLNFRAIFEATAEVSGIEKALNEVIDNEELHKDRLKYDEDCV